jgi:hypothetical protein
MSNLETKPTQCQRILNKLIEANGAWVSSRCFIREMWISQTSSRLIELKNKGYNIQYGDDFGIPRDEYGYTSYRLPVEHEQQKLI